MKANNFKWAYNNYNNLRNDPVMTRDILAKKVRAWRKHGFTVTRSVSNGVHTLRVQTGGLIAYSEFK